MRTITVAIVVLSLLVPAAALAQQASTRVHPAPQPPNPPPPPQPGPGRDLGRWWKNSDVVQELQLSQAQINQIESSFLEHRLKLIDLRADLERQETRLQPLIEADQPDEAKVGAQIDLVVAARGRLEKANTLMMLAIRRVLSVDQWKKLQGMQQRGPRFSGQGHAGPDQPGPGRHHPAQAAPSRPPDQPDDLNDPGAPREPLPRPFP